MSKEERRGVQEKPKSPEIGAVIFFISLAFLVCVLAFTLLWLERKKPALVKNIEQAATYYSTDDTGKTTEIPCEPGEIGNYIKAQEEAIKYLKETIEIRDDTIKYQRKRDDDLVDAYESLRKETFSNFSIIYKNIDETTLEAHMIQGIDPDWIDYVDWAKAAKEIREKYGFAHGVIDLKKKSISWTAKKEK